MAIRDKYFPGTAVSRYLVPGERSWDEAVYQSGKPVLDSELNLSQEVSKEIRRLIQDHQLPSGWLRGQIPLVNNDFSASATVNTFVMKKRVALVSNMPVVVEYTSTTTAGQCDITLDAAPVFGGSPPDVKRTDFVFLEVWRCVVSTSPRASATTEIITNANVTAGDIITINGTPLTAVSPGPAVADEFVIGANGNATAAAIAAAINLGTNSFTSICTAAVDVSNSALVNLKAADALAGVAGNAITLTLTLGTGGCIQVNGGAGPTTFSGGSDTGNKPTQATLYRHGNVQAPAGVNLADDIADPTIGTESTKRVQVQYRIRTTGQSEAVNFKTQDGFSNSNVTAQGVQSAAVAGYPFVKADGATVLSNSSAVAYDTVDAGLWIAGDGSSTAATALGTVDGYVYAIPIAFAFRRNDSYNSGAGAGWSPLTNTNGALPQTHGGFTNPLVGAIPANTSDRPDGRYHDQILVADLLDLRRQVSPGGIDMKAELERQMTALMDGNFATWALDASDKNQLGGGTGDVGTQFLVCNEIGRSGSKGGTPPTSGSTNRGDQIGDFDHVRRRFADWPVVERRIFPILPTDLIGAQPGKYVTKSTGGYTTWEAGDVISIDLDALDATGLGGWANAPSGTPTGGGGVSNLWPLGTKVTDVLRVIHDDGNYSGSVSKTCQIDKVEGIGTPLVEITLGRNNVQATGGISVAAYDLVGVAAAGDNNSPRRIFIELEITYPAGSGTTDTPSVEVVPAAAVYGNGPVLENDTAQRPDDWEVLLQPQIRTGFRELGVEYAANDGSGAGSGTPITETVVSDSPLLVTLPRRIYGSATTTVTVTDTVSTLTRPVNTAATTYGSSQRLLVVQGGSPFSGAGQTLVSIDYFAQDPLPNWGAVGYQIACYYRTDAPQTLGVQAGAPGTVPLPSTLTVKPLVMSRELWTGTMSAGSVDAPFPYTNPLDQIAVNGDLSTSPFTAEWVIAGSARISVGDFSAATGLLSLHQMVPAHGNQDFAFSSLDVDSEFRVAYKVSDTSTYRPTAMAQPLSGVSAHKVWFPFLARASADTVLYRKDEVLLVVVSRFAILDADNTVRFVDTSNDTCAAVYRTRGILLLASE
jgi:hypothetical protein